MCIRDRHMAGWNMQIQKNAIGGYSFLLPEYKRFITGAFWLTTFRLDNQLSVTGGIRYDRGRIDICLLYTSLPYAPRKKSWTTAASERSWMYAVWTPVPYPDPLQASPECHSGYGKPVSYTHLTEVLITCWLIRCRLMVWLLHLWTLVIFLILRKLFKRIQRRCLSRL